MITKKFLCLLLLGLLLSNSCRKTHESKYQYLPGMPSSKVQKLHEQKPIFKYQSDITADEKNKMVINIRRLIENYEHKSGKKVFFCEVYPILRGGNSLISLPLGLYHDYVFYDRNNRFLGYYRDFID